MTDFAGEEKTEAARTGGAARVEGVLISPMRHGGTELLVGVVRDPQWGPVLAVAVGGIFVEVLRDVSLRVLPADADEVGRMLTELRGLPLLTGARGAMPADLDALAKVISGIGELACSLAGLRALEVNPLWVRGNQIEALDVLVLTDQAGNDQHENNRTEPAR